MIYISFFNAIRCVGGMLGKRMYGHSRFSNTDFDDKLAWLDLSSVITGLNNPRHDVIRILFPYHYTGMSLPRHTSGYYRIGLPGIVISTLYLGCCWQRAARLCSTERMRSLSECIFSSKENSNWRSTREINYSASSI